MANEKNVLTQKNAQKKNYDVQQKLEMASRNLFYVSETDAPFEIFKWKRKEQTNEKPNAEEILNLTDQETTAKVTEKTLDEFFAQPTQIQDWFGEEEKSQAEKFSDLKDLLAKDLRETKVFKIGEIQIDIYIVGVDAEGNLTGVRTKAVET